MVTLTAPDKYELYSVHHNQFGLLKKKTPT